MFGLEGGEYKTELKTGAFCCIVASRPLITTKSSPHSNRDLPSLSQDDALQWRTNLSYSPAGYTRDGLEQDMNNESHGFALYSSRSRQRNSLESRFEQSPRWASNSSTSGGDEQKTSIVNSLPQPSSSNPQCLNVVSWSSLHFQYINLQDKPLVISSLVEPCISGEKF